MASLLPPRQTTSCISSVAISASGGDDRVAGLSLQRLVQSFEHVDRDGDGGRWPCLPPVRKYETSAVHDDGRCHRNAQPVRDQPLPHTSIREVRSIAAKRSLHSRAPAITQIHSTLCRVAISTACMRQTQHNVVSLLIRPAPKPRRPSAPPPKPFVHQNA